MKASLLLLSILISHIIHAQQDSLKTVSYRRFEQKSIAILGGYYYYERHGIELGIGKKSDAAVGHHPITDIIYVSTEVARYNGNLLWGPKIGVMLMGGCCGGSMGLSLIYYTHPEGNSLKFRPEIGFGVTAFRFFYGRSFSITNQEFWPVSKNLFGVNIAIGIIRLNKESTEGSR